MSTESNNKTGAGKGVNTGRIITIVVLAALVAALSYFVYAYYNEKDKNEQQVLHVDELTAEIQEFETSLEDYKIKLDDTNLDIEEKERLLAEKEQELLEKQKEIQALAKANKISKAQAEHLKNKVDQLEYYIKKYQKEIDELREQVDALTDENETLADSIRRANSELNEVSRELGATRHIVKAASVLQAFGFEYYRVKGTGKEIKDVEFRRGQMETFKVCFNIMENLAAEGGKRDVYVQIIDPNGKVIKDMAGQSGYFKHLDQDLTYTVKTSIDYNRTTQNVCVQFNEPDGYEYEKGTHSVIVYTDGYDIGKGRFEVK